MEDFNLILIIHSALTYIMVGVIWFVQIVHYPLYKKIKEGFAEYEKQHMRRSAFLIGPVMTVEAATSLFLIGLAQEPILARLAALNIIFLTISWITTLLFQVAQHQKLALRFSSHVHNMLLGTNWIRVTLWTLRGIILGVMLSMI